MYEVLSQMLNGEKEIQITSILTALKGNCYSQFYQLVIWKAAAFLSEIKAGRSRLMPIIGQWSKEGKENTKEELLFETGGKIQTKMCRIITPVSN